MNDSAKIGQLVARKEGAIGWIVISNPSKRNALSFEMWRDFPRLLSGFADDPEIRMVVLTGAGEHFAAGADISQFGEKRSQGEALAQYNETLKHSTTALLDFPKPLVAKIRGACVGGEPESSAPAESPPERICPFTPCMPSISCPYRSRISAVSRRWPR